MHPHQPMQVEEKKCEKTSTVQVATRDLVMCWLGLVLVLLSNLSTNIVDGEPGVWPPGRVE